MCWVLSWAIEGYVFLALPLGLLTDMKRNKQKLQRRIANARGISPSTSLVSPARPAVEDVKPDTPRTELSRPEATHEVQGVAKRKYRRHPKVRENLSHLVQRRPATDYYV